MAELTRVAVVGAAGFLGNRTVEMMHLSGGYEVVPIVRRASGLALAGRFDVEPAIADAFDEGALVSALRGCDSVVLAVAGDPATIVGVVGPVYRAADRAGVRRLVHLSSASVHGQAPAPGTSEGSPISRRQPFAYNRAKAVAEDRLLDARARGRTEVVILRPSIVHGPRSQWTGGLAEQLLAGDAFLADGGVGVCNSGYVDNVVHAICLAAAVPADGVDGEAFFVGDAEPVSWYDLVAPVATALGIDVRDLPSPPSSVLSRRPRPHPARLLVPPLRSAYRRLPQRVAGPLRAALRASRAAEPSEEPGLSAEAARELALLHSCRVRLPQTKAADRLGYQAIVTFEEACRRSVAWLGFAGYPVQP